MKTFLIAALVFFIATVAHAGQKASVGSLRAQVPVEMVTALVSVEGESKDDFLRRAGGLLEGYTDRTGFEACASVCQSPTRTGVYITSSKAHAYCAAIDRCPLSDMTNTGETIHSHPQEKRYVVNQNDAIFSNFRHKRGERRSVDPDRFSDLDYAGGSGYLVTAGEVRYQQGKGRESVIGPTIKPEETILPSIVR
jgi:hypothetical protein